MDQSNPYAPVAAAKVQQTVASSPPIFCHVMFVLSMLFCALRLPLLVFDLAESGMGHDPAFDPLVLPSMISNMAILTFGLVGNALLLGRIAWGIPFAVCLILAVTVSIGADIWGLVIAQSLTAYRSTLLGLILSFALPGIRIALLLFYAIAVMLFWKWSVSFRQRASN